MTTAEGVKGRTWARMVGAIGAIGAIGRSGQGGCPSRPSSRVRLARGHRLLDAYMVGAVLYPQGYLTYLYGYKEGRMAFKRTTLPAEPFMTPAVYHILLALGDGERHGYALLRAIAANPDAPNVGPTTLYRALRHMLDDTLVVITDERPDPALDDVRREYYRLTPRGREVALAETERLGRIVTTARAKPLLQGTRPVDAPASGVEGAWRPVPAAGGA